MSQERVVECAGKSGRVLIIGGSGADRREIELLISSLEQKVLSVECQTEQAQTRFSATDTSQGPRNRWGVPT